MILNIKIYSISAIAASSFLISACNDEVSSPAAAALDNCLFLKFNLLVNFLVFKAPGLLPPPPPPPPPPQAKSFRYTFHIRHYRRNDLQVFHPQKET
ncbi:MAG: hypothetical protein CM15mP15_3030 [Prochlorococcus sp.]|nr:MAG: hypothetical protein CM15mP15_3030 [Prochlorococcus sp.]